MDLPKIDIEALPEAETPTGVFGSLADGSGIQPVDDSIVYLMTFLYEVPHVTGLF